MDMSKLCRTCLKESNQIDMISIFASRDDVNIERIEIISVPMDNSEQPTTINFMLEACSTPLSVKIHGLPTQMCKPCVRDLESAYEFRKRCENALTKLKIFLHGDDETEQSEFFKSESHADALKITDNKHNDKAMENPNEKYVQTDDSSIFVCELCPMKFFNILELRTHRATHKDTEIKCQICSKDYSRMAHLQRHIASTHPDEFNISVSHRTHVCQVCDRQFNRSDHLSKHVRNVHKGMQQVKREIVDVQEEYEEEMVFDGGASGCDDEVAEGVDYVSKDSSNAVTDQNGSSLIKNKELEFATEPNQEQNATDSLDKSNRAKETDALVDITMMVECNIKAENTSESESCDDNNDSDEEYHPDDDSDIGLRKPAAVAAAATKKQTKPQAKSSVEKTYVCAICPKIYKSFSEYMSHRSEHAELQKPNPSNQCYQCKKLFSRSSHLKRHMLIHSEIRPFSCDLCSKAFRRKEHLRNHIASCQQSKNREEERKTQKFECEICSKTFLLDKYLKRHLLIHSRVSYDCRTCKEKFPTSKELNEHTKCHATERPFLCSECGLRFIRQDYLNIHTRKHTGERPFKCRYCHKGFTRSNLLASHERYHTGQKTHLCTVCGKGFVENSNLQVHMRTHTGEKPYQCPHCDRSFTQSNDLKAHIRRHTGERYSCDVCGEQFIQNYHLTRHRYAKHGIAIPAENVRAKCLPALEIHPSAIEAKSTEMENVNVVAD